MLRIRTIAAIVAVLVAVVIAAAIIVTNNVNQKPQIQRIDGIAYIETEEAGMVEVTPESYEYNLSGRVETVYGRYELKTVKVKTPVITTSTPIELPNTSAASPDSCPMLDASGNKIPSKFDPRGFVHVPCTQV